MIYEFRLFTRRGQSLRSFTAELDGDDHAIDRAARIQHRYVIEVSEGERLVWRFEELSSLSGRPLDFDPLLKT